MNEWIIQAIPHAARSAYASLVSTQWQLFLQADETAFFGASIHELPCGALLARTSNGRFEVVSLIVSEEHRHQGIATALWHAAEQAAIEQGCGTLDVCYQISDFGNNTLLTGTEPAKRHIFYTQKPLFRSTPMLPEWGGIMARSNALMDILANAGGSVSLVTNPGMLPYLIWQPGNGMRIRLFYSLNDQTYTSFSLSAELSSNTSAKKLKPLTKIMEEDPGPAQLVPDTTGKLLALVGVLEEGAVLDPTQTLDSFLMPFIEQAKRLLTMMKENEN